MRIERFDVDRPIPYRAHDLRQTFGVVLIGLVDSHLQCGLYAAGIQTLHINPSATHAINDECRRSSLPSLIALPGLGGNQYINSASVGAWEDYLLEMLPVIEQRGGCAAAAFLVRVPADMAQSRTRCVTLTSGRRRPVIPAIWVSSCAICPTCRR